uniref:SAM-dependent MTase TRM10-type domain-containing protein n=1 Tax=Globodera pallida TaxID=36090 RepID=A0A183C1X4_GLOPA
MANDPKLKEKVERVQKEYEIYEYFSEFIPKLFGDKQWIQTLKCTSVNERVKFWGFLALSHHRRELDSIKHDRDVELTERYLQEQVRLYNAGGMGYSDETYCMLSNSFLSRSYAARKNRTIQQSKSLATQLTLGESPRILFDCQYFPQMDLRHYSRTSKTAAHTYFSNIYMPSPFPHAFINVEPKDRNTRDFFHYKIAHIATSRNWSIRPALYTNDPFHDPNETDPPQASFGAIKKGNYKGLAVPIRKYINWKSGPLFLPWIVLLKILDEVRQNGGDWEYALNKYVPKRNLRTTEERKVAMGLRRYEVMKERWHEKQRITELIIEALGEELG